MATVDINLTRGAERVVVDDVDVARYCESVEIHASPDEGPRVVLYLSAPALAASGASVSLAGVADVVAVGPASDVRAVLAYLRELREVYARNRPDDGDALPAGVAAAVARLEMLHGRA